MKKFFENCGWGYVVIFTALILMIICGAAMMGVGMWGWLTAECDVAAGIGMFEFINNPNIIHVGVGLMIASPIIVIIGVIHFLRVRHRIEIEATRRKQVTEMLEREFRETADEIAANEKK